MPGEGGSARGLGFILVLTPFLLWTFLLVVIPHIDLLLISLREKVAPRVFETGLGNYDAFFGERVYVMALVRTVVMSLIATALTLLIGFPVAYYIAKIAKGRARTGLFMICLIPFWVSELVRVFGWMILLRETGIISGLLQYLGLVDGPVELLYNDVAVMVGLVYTSMLFMVVPLISTLDSLDDALIEAGYDLGGNGFVVLREVVVPHAMPGIVAGCIVVFMLSLGNYLTPTLLGGKNSQWFTAQIYSQFITRFNWEVGSAFGFVLLAASSLIVWLALQRHRPVALHHHRAGIGDAELAAAKPAAARRLCRLHRAVPVLSGGTLAVVATFAFNDSLAPSLPWRGFTLDWFFGSTEPKLGLFFDRNIMRGIGNSLMVGVRHHGAGAAVRHHDGLPVRALRVPPEGPVLHADAGAAGDPRRHTRHLHPRLLQQRRQCGGRPLRHRARRRCGRGWFWSSSASSPSSPPIATLVIAARLRKFDRSLEEAALNLGASQPAVLATVTLPYLKPALIGAGLIAFLMSFENFNTTLMLVGFRSAAHHHHVRPHEAGLDPSAERRVAVPDDRFRPARADQRAGAARQDGELGP